MHAPGLGRNGAQPRRYAVEARPGAPRAIAAPTGMGTRRESPRCRVDRIAIPSAEPLLVPAQLLRAEPLPLLNDRQLALEMGACLDNLTFSVSAVRPVWSGRVRPPDSAVRVKA